VDTRISVIVMRIMVNEMKIGYRTRELKNQRFPCVVASVCFQYEREVLGFRVHDFT
jgi:UDP-N-acetylenolpyruvoylglucosamine reductase